MSDTVITLPETPITVVSTDLSPTIVSIEQTTTVVSIEQSVTTLSMPSTVVSVISAGLGLQGPPGAPTYPGKTLIWASGILTEVLLYLDAAKTQLAEHRILNRTSGILTSINFFDGDGAATKTRTLGYTSGALTSVTEA